jgi:uncharacterized membrane protein YhaH (DUF805 family)
MTPWFLNFSFEGRARRSHAWANYFAWTGAMIVGLMVFAVIAEIKSSVAEPVAGLALFALFVCAIVDHWAMHFRRAHDTNKSGWVCLLLLIPFVNLLVLYWLLIEDSDAGPNKYGPPVKLFYTPQAPWPVAP